MKNRQAVFISGKGSNLKALVDTYPNDTFFVYASKNCQGLSWAKRRGFYTEILESDINWTDFANKLNELMVSKILLLGFMKIVPETFLNTVGAEVLNIHPSLLPSFPGLKSAERSFEASDGMGCSFHKVVPEVDAGEIVLQKKIEKTKSFKKFKEVLHGFEHMTVQKNYELTRGTYG